MKGTFLNLLKMVLILSPIITSLNLMAHDEGHGPKLAESSKYGGVIAPIINAKDADKGHDAALVYKAELIRTEDGKMRIYIYDEKSKPVDINKFEKYANGVLLVSKKKKTTKLPFSLKIEENTFVGVAPKASSKPFDIEITLKEGKNKLLVEFHNLD